MEVLPHHLGHARPHARCGRQGFHAGELDRIDRAEVGEQLLDPLRPHPRDIGEPRALHPLTSLLAVEAHGEAVRLIPQTPQQLHPQLLRFALQRFLRPRDKHFFALLGQRAHHQLFIEVELAQGLHHGGELPLAAIDHHHIGPVVQTTGVQSATGGTAQLTQIDTLRFGLGPAAEAAADHFSHAHEVVRVARSNAAALNLVFAVVLLGRQAIDEHHLGGHGITALDVADVVALNPARRAGQLEQLGQILGSQQVLLTGATGPLQLVAGIALHQLNQVGLLGALRHRQLHLAAAQLR